MRHYGDITKIKGNSVPIVDCVIGGSPCQDLSVAGKRAGLDGERSGLFIEQIRIIKELRDEDRRNRNITKSDISVRPRYGIWENVPGAFSSNQGEDFRIVLEEFCKVADDKVSIPQPDKGKWTTSGCIYGDNFSVAWRVLDAQWWGVPQRRRRIALIADFNGHNAPYILFNQSEHFGETKRDNRDSSVGYIGTESRSEVQPISESLSGNTEQSQQKRKETSTDVTGSIGAGNIAYTMQDREGCDGGGKGALIQKDRATSLRTNNYMTVFQPVQYPDLQDKTGSLMASGYDKLGTQEALNGMYIVEACNWDGSQVAPTLTANNAGGSQRMPDKENFNCVIQPVVYKGDGAEGGETAYAIVVNHENRPTDMTNLVCLPCVLYNKVRYIVRRLTPMECERLQGYPDRWTDIGEWTNSKGKKVKTADSVRYKALGNSIALSQWKWVIKRLCGCYERPATMASLFDGIGGFPLCWEQVNGRGSCLWASEIEDFPIAVTEVRING